MDDLAYVAEFLPDELHSRVQSELVAGERLVWVGQPRADRFARQMWPIVLFGIPWTAISLIWVVVSSQIMFGDMLNGGAGHPLGALGIIFPLMGLPAIVVGIFLLSSPFWQFRRAKRTCYALTNRRAILWEAGWFNRSEVRSFGPTDLAKIRRVEYPDGSGDLVWEEFATRDNGRTTNTLIRGYMGISRVREIEELLRKTLLLTDW